MSNPEKKPTPQEELEMRITALLMGELPPDEATALEAQVAADPALTVLRARLHKAMELLREASTEPDAPASETPVQLSSERRAQLLAHFQTPRTKPSKPEPIIQPAPTSWKQKRDWTWVIPLGIAATVVALIAIGIGGIVPFATVTDTPDFAAPASSFVSVNTDSDKVPAAPADQRSQEFYKLTPMEPQPAQAITTTAGVIRFNPSGLTASTAPSVALKPSAMPPAAKAQTQLPITGDVTAGAPSAGVEFAGSFGLPSGASARAAHSNSKSVDELAATKAPAPSTIYLGNATADVAFADAKENTKRGFATDVNGKEAMVKSGSGNLALNGANSYSGGTAINGGTLILGDTSTTGISPQNQSAATTKLARSGGADKRAQAPKILEDVRVVDSAIDQYAIQSNKPIAGEMSGGQLVQKPITFTGDGGTLNVGKDVAVGTGALSFNDNSRSTPASREKTRNTAGAKTPEQVKQLFTEAQGLYDNGRYDQAKKRAEQILSADPNNIAARNFEKKIDRSMSDYGIAALNETRADGITKPDMALARPIRRSDASKEETAAVDEEKTQKNKAAKEAAVSTTPIPQPEIQTSENAFSTFSLNVSDVSFKLAAASLEQGHMPDPASVRSEEFINAFNYRDPEPAPGAPLAFASERARYPFAQNRDLLRFAVKTAATGRQAGRPLNIVLLLDKSGSMERADRVNIVHEALRILATQLQSQDKLSIVTFARTPRLWADGVTSDKVNDVIARVDEITPEGGTNLEAALDLGYETAHRHFTPDSINRVVLFTDGAANLGDINPDALAKKVEAQRKQGIALDCFGIGWEGYNDNLLEQLTRNADGRYGFINTPEDATSNFAAQLAGALQVAASDVKVQVEFNPRRVKAYRQIGYATHQLTKEQFRDNTVNAAQIGAAESGNALYVVEVDPRGEGDLATVHVRFRVPGTSDYREHEWPVPFTGEAQPLEQSSSALRLAGAASAFSEMLASSPYATEVTSDRLLNILSGVPPIYGADPRPTKLEWMIRQARSLSGR